MMQTYSARNGALPDDLITAIARYRHKVFIERLRWPLAVEDGLEHDQFDRHDTVYVVARDADGEIFGCARLLPTLQPYLLGDVFPDLFDGAEPPCSEEVWELSRFAMSRVATGRDGVRVEHHSRRLLAQAVSTASAFGARRLVTVSPLSVERLLRQMDVHVRRAGPVLKIDGKPVCACIIELDRRTHHALDICPL
jgi:acyl homoserine lactone synthase